MGAGPDSWHLRINGTPTERQSHEGDSAPAALSPSATLGDMPNPAASGDGEESGACWHRSLERKPKEAGQTA